MAKVGYIFNSEQYDTFTFDRAWMEKYGYCRIIEDSASQEKTRPEWKQLMDCLERGDELVISKFSNALRGVRELAMFLEFCRVKVIRVISIQEKIDSKGELFPSTSIADVLFMFGSLIPASPLPCANVCDTTAKIIAARRMILFFLFINRFFSVPWGLDGPGWRLILLFTNAA